MVFLGKTNNGYDVRYCEPEHGAVIYFAFIIPVTLIFYHSYHIFISTAPFFKKEKEKKTVKEIVQKNVLKSTQSPCLHDDYDD